MSTTPNSNPTNSDSNTASNGGTISIDASDSPLLGSFQFPSLQIRFDRTNYTLWRNTVKSALEAYDLDFLLQPSNTQPHAQSDSPTPNPNYVIWKKKDQLVLLWIRSTLSTPLLAHVARATTASEAWQILEKMFHAQTRARLMHLKQQMHTFSKGNLSILEYFERKRSFSDSLAECSVLVPDEEFVECVLHGLDASYDAFRTAINMKSESVSSDELFGLLLREEERHQAAASALELNQS